MSAVPEMKISAIAPWFGSKRTMAGEIIRQLGPHHAYWEPFCGSMSVLLAKPRSAMETVSDLHGELTNLAWVVQDQIQAPILYQRLSRTLYSEELFDEAKARWEANDYASRIGRAYDYFLCSWMGRNGVSGTDRINYQQAIRWTTKGGSGPTRFRSAVESIPAWHDRLRNVLILNRDALTDVIPKIEDEAVTAIYLDPPYLAETRAGDGGASGGYVHDFEDADHLQLADLVKRFTRARVVISYYDSPRLDELYPGWTKVDCARHKHLRVQNKRGSERQEAPEVLLINGPPAEEGARDLFG